MVSSRRIISSRSGTARSAAADGVGARRSEEHTSELQSLAYLVCRLLLEKKKGRPTRRSSSCGWPATKAAAKPTSRPSRSCCSCTSRGRRPRKKRSATPWSNGPTAACPSRSRTSRTPRTSPRWRSWSDPRTFFFFNDTPTTEIYTLSLHDALPILMFLTLMRPSLVLFLVLWLKLVKDFLKVRCRLALLPFLISCLIWLDLVASLPLIKERILVIILLLHFLSLMLGSVLVLMLPLDRKSVV